jgi:hypothetical protein
VDVLQWLPMKSKTEQIVDTDACYLEFDLQQEVGYEEWQGLFFELGVKGSLFNGYMMQTAGREVRISTTPVQLRVYAHSLYLVPPFEREIFYVEIARACVRLGRVYFRLPAGMDPAKLDGHKPQREDLYAIDIWFTRDAGDEICTLIYEASIMTDQTEYRIRRFSSGRVR